MSTLPNPCPPLDEDLPESRPKAKGTNDKNDIAVLQIELLGLEKERATSEINKLALEKRKLELEMEVLNLKKKKLSAEIQHVSPGTSRMQQSSYYSNNSTPFDFSFTNL